MSEKVTIQIMGEEFTIKCSPEEKTFLIKAATLVDETMTKIKSQGTAFSINRIAVMAALNIARDAINGSSDMAANIRTEHDADLDMIEIKKRLDGINKQVKNSLNSETELKLQ
ncbi:MAG: cell division protein ZapA [Gammaproteobacteria bacterium]|jgi:cell division protein ZapA|nr:cell division protein ZapA [Gammaproteobacteria bacterium]MBT5217193.1 cell division protein ZapA [Gammaproteobacteria bacterium]MBT5541620.1 cell division protein ZapA [Gammaproteobacteria bacterium]MBT6074861.1 cell division protein ZapA [Gammaproteobacteria bacterium]MBT7753195.1 cell division protein ZapA [Gammaproteobacteria bacterium]